MGISILPILIDKFLCKQVTSEQLSVHCGLAVTLNTSKGTEALGGGHSWWDRDSNYSYLTAGSMRGLTADSISTVDRQMQTPSVLLPLHSSSSAAW